MSRRETVERAFPELQLTRRQALRAAAGGGLVLGAAKAVDNVLIGYGEVVGTNLVDQAASGELASIADVGLHPRRGTEVSLEGASVTLQTDLVRVHEDGDLLAERPLTVIDRSWAAGLGLPGGLRALAANLGAIARDEHSFEFHPVDDFFERVAGASPQSQTVDVLRRWKAAETHQVEAFTQVDPADPRAVLNGLVAGFREHTYYDAPRYLAGSIQDNVIFGAVDLRAPFRDPVDFESIGGDEKVGMFCYEFTHRSLEALHAVPAPEQTVPVLAARVWDKRHKHVYTAVASVVRDDDGLSIPMTFVDYTHTTLYDDARLRGLLGEGFEAYNPRHRATVIHWSPYG